MDDKAVGINNREWVIHVVTCMTIIHSYALGCLGGYYSLFAKFQTSFTLVSTSQRLKFFNIWWKFCDIFLPIFGKTYEIPSRMQLSLCATWLCWILPNFNSANVSGPYFRTSFILHLALNLTNYTKLNTKVVNSYFRKALFSSKGENISENLSNVTSLLKCRNHTKMILPLHFLSQCAS